MQCSAESYMCFAFRFTGLVNFQLLHDTCYSNLSMRIWSLICSMSSACAYTCTMCTQTMPVPTVHERKAYLASKTLQAFMKIYTHKIAYYVCLYNGCNWCMNKLTLMDVCMHTCQHYWKFVWHSEEMYTYRFIQLEVFKESWKLLSLCKCLLSFDQLHISVQLLVTTLI